MINLFIANSTFGKIEPTGTAGSIASITLAGFLNQIITLLYTLSGIFFLFNFIMAGYLYLTSEAQPQKITQASNKLLQSFIGLGIVAISFVIASALGYFLFKDATALITPSFYNLN